MQVLQFNNQEFELTVIFGKKLFILKFKKIRTWQTNIFVCYVRIFLIFKINHFRVRKP